jgi:hypothetical protein
VNAVGWTGWSGPTYGPLEMLYACENVRTLTYGAKLNLPPNAAFRAPGFVEGTYGLECLLDELAARLELDPLELRGAQPRRPRTSSDGRPFSSKKLLECYDRAEEHWAARDEVRARSEGAVPRGTGLASQIWYGGGGPPSYAWVRVGSTARATVYRDAGHRHRLAHRDGADRGARSSGCRSNGCASRSATRPADRTPRSRPAPRRRRRWARRCGGRGRRRPADPRDRGAAVPTSRSACSRSSDGRDRLGRRRLVAARGGHGLLEDAQITGKGRAGRTRPGCAC